MKLMRRLAVIGIFMLASVTLATSAQAPVTTPSFEVASIRLEEPHTMEEMRRGIGMFSMNTWPTSHYFAHYVPLLGPISIAFNIEQKWITGGPDWFNDQLYSIDAKVDGGSELSMDEMRPLLQNLLTQRFHLKVHRENRITSGYILVVAKGGPKLTPAATEGKPQVNIFRNGLNGRSLDMGTLASAMQYASDHRVVDHTGLTGSYDITLKYAPPDDPNANSDLPDIFTAIQEQLGLKLEPAKVPVDYLVIDHVDRIPTEN